MTCTCVRVPVLRSHSISVTLVSERKISVAEARAAVASRARLPARGRPRCQALPDAAGNQRQDLVFVGRIRDDLTNENGLSLWCCGDQVRKGAATNAVQIAELLLR